MDNKQHVLQVGSLDQLMLSKYIIFPVLTPVPPQCCTSWNIGTSGTINPQALGANRMASVCQAFQGSP